jgi:hypothetical protein
MQWLRAYLLQTLKGLKLICEDKVVISLGKMKRIRVTRETSPS